MYVVLFGICIAFIVVLIVTVGAAGSSSANLKREAAKQKREEEERQKAEEELALLQVPGQPLICLGCQKKFLGPMPSDGCPDCRITSLVVPVTSKKRSRKKAVQGD